MHCYYTYVFYAFATQLTLSRESILFTVYNKILTNALILIFSPF